MTSTAELPGPCVFTSTHPPLPRSTFTVRQDYNTQHRFGKIGRRSALKILQSNKGCGKGVLNCLHSFLYIKNIVTCIQDISGIKPSVGKDDSRTEWCEDSYVAAVWCSIDSLSGWVNSYVDIITTCKAAVVSKLSPKVARCTGVVILVVEAVTWAPGHGTVGKVGILDWRGWMGRLGYSTSCPFLVDWGIKGTGLNRLWQLQQ